MQGLQIIINLMSLSFNKALNLFTITGGVIAALNLAQASSVVLFQLSNNVPFDDAGAASMMGATISGSETVIATTVDILAPEYEEAALGGYIATGDVVSLLNGDDVRTNITSGNNSLGINNPTISNSNYQASFSVTNESQSFNFGESWVLEFDTTVRITEIDFATLDANEGFDIMVEGDGAVYSFASGAASDIFADPLNGLVISAGNNVTITATGSVDVTSVRIADFTVVTVPEPSASGLLVLGGAGLLIRRRK